MSTDVPYPPAVIVNKVHVGPARVEFHARVENQHGLHGWAAVHTGPRTWELRADIPGLSGPGTKVCMLRNAEYAPSAIRAFHQAMASPRASRAAAVAASGYPEQWYPGRDGRVCPCPAGGRDSECPEHGVRAGGWAAPERLRGGVDDPGYVSPFDEG